MRISLIEHLCEVNYEWWSTPKDHRSVKLAAENGHIKLSEANSFPSQQIWNVYYTHSAVTTHKFTCLKQKASSCLVEHFILADLISSISSDLCIICQQTKVCVWLPYLDVIVNHFQSSQKIFPITNTCSVYRPEIARTQKRSKSFFSIFYEIF